MDWDQIESKWAAMTRRVRGDLTFTTPDASGRMPRQMAKADAASGLSVEQQANVNGDQRAAMSTQ